ncbi:MAG: bifunctional folylpolyglutamate synthase/dihydrofolate synthase [Clostridiales bacterium]|nr:bifunctional folylpolyglutamate synthase/dihydrofolate synthase [Clostridiales bacterium]
MNYSEAIAYIHGTYKFGRKLGLDNINQLLEKMGNPENELKVIHVAGTNGKGSTSAFIANILIESGYSVGLFSSPFLQIFNERIRLNRMNIPNQSLADITAFVKEKVDEMVMSGKDHPTEFEIVTAIAFEFYKREKADIVVLEVGMGGRLDSTNVILKPLCSVITPIAMDHTDYLGDTMALIAGEKAGIIKENSPVVVHPQEVEALKVIEAVAKDRNSKMILVDQSTIEIIKESLTETKFKYLNKSYSISLLGRHQTRNAAVAIEVAKLLNDMAIFKIDSSSIENGLKVTVWPGRMEIINKEPLVIIDGAHNEHGARGLKDTLEHLLKSKKVIGVVGILEDKDVDAIIKHVVPLLDEVIVTQPNSPRSMPYIDLMNHVREYHDNVSGFERILEAIIEARARANKEDVVLVFGSLYLIGEVRSILIE